MEKPIALIINELKQNIVKEINKTQLPLVVIEPIVKNIYEELKQITEEQSKREIEAYYSSIEKNKDSQKEE